ncbi:MAG: peptidoglycan DD-metalloendopeptidase family protein [Pseudomonadales bacterium]|nr:peptidoglycan DD-metalloendopeptidase family protein [Pseudomonadales bacterium]
MNFWKKQKADAGSVQSLFWQRSNLLLSLCLLGLPALIGGFMGYHIALSQEDVLISRQTTEVWRKDIEEQQQAVEETRRISEQTLQALTKRVGQLQAQMLRLDALGERLVNKAGLADGEFDFSAEPALGGPQGDELQRFEALESLQMIDDLSLQIESRSQQLGMLDLVLSQKQLNEETYLSGRPVKRGWLSSHYGYRTDPFTGKKSWHNGIDFAGKAGSEVIAVASGVVVASEKREGYGYMVEVNHGDSFSSRYAHNQKNLVKVGDVVEKGQPLAIMGSTGRSTGPHVHFEIYKNGRSVDPASYIKRTHR